MYLHPLTPSTPQPHREVTSGGLVRHIAIDYVAHQGAYITVGLYSMHHKTNRKSPAGITTTLIQDAHKQHTAIHKTKSSSVSNSKTNDSKKKKKKLLSYRTGEPQRLGGRGPLIDRTATPTSTLIVTCIPPNLTDTRSRRPARYTG